MESGCEGKEIAKNAFKLQKSFHYLTKYCDLSGQRPAPCSCSDVVRKDIPEKLPDIRSFLTKFPKRYWGTLDPPRNDFSIPQTVSKNIDDLSREDLLRREHDRGKKKKNRKERHACLNVFAQAQRNFFYLFIH